ncbi:MAG: TraR/DksA C4-type zinc finger protein [Propionibacteriales bacterium]|nr:TraR/DksA C4-type zinc finger protein [Propionibacteriales bacterium]
MAGDRERLEEKLRSARARLARLTDDFDDVVAASRDTNADDEHDPEGATIAFERSQLSAVIQQTRVQVTEARAALIRWDSGDYGVCERCGQPIGAERLEARPTASQCIACARTVRR